MTELLTTAQAAALLGVTPGTLTVWRCDQRYPLKFIKVGRNVRYTAKAIEEFLAARTVNGDGSRTLRRRKSAYQEAA